ncbi:MAG: carbohydrate ABC transporter permease [Anaerolineales bacterium]|jgi:ABC-type glycerol-3-phosphate transport system permease component
MVSSIQLAHTRSYYRKWGLRFLRIAITYILLVVIALFCIFPIAWIIKTSFESPGYISNVHVQWLPIQFTWDNYRNVLNNPRAMIGRSFLNSLFVSSVSTALSVLITTLAGYAMSRFTFRGKFVFGLYLLLINMIPSTLILISMFVLLIKLHLVNSYGGLIVYYASFGLPLATWMLKGHFDSIPIELEEQAMIDGDTRLGAIRHIILPLAVPGIAAVSIVIFMSCWTEFMAALTILQRQELRTLPVQIINFMGFQRVDWGPVMAYSVIVGLPVALLFILVQKQLVGGLTSGFSK